LSGHDEILTDDIVTTLNLNYEWRRVVSDALQAYADSIILPIDANPTNDDSELDDYRNQWQDLIDDLYTLENVVDEPLAVHVSRNANQALAANVPEFVVWDNLIVSYPTVIWDDDELEILRVPSIGVGWWLISGVILFAAASSGARLVQIVHNETIVYTSAHTSAAAERVVFSHHTFLAPGDIIRIQVTSAQSLNILGGLSSSLCSLVRIYGNRS